jgi:hypothetical protein
LQLLSTPFINLCLIHPQLYQEQVVLWEPHYTLTEQEKTLNSSFPHLVNMAQFAREATRTTFADHNGDEIMSTSFGKMKDTMMDSRHSSDSGLGMPSPEKLPLLIYVNSCIPAADLDNVPAHFQSLIDGRPCESGSEHTLCKQTDLDLDFEVIVAPQGDVFAAIDHYRREKVHRKHAIDAALEPLSEIHRIPHTYARRGAQSPPKSSVTSSTTSFTSNPSRSSSLQPSAVKVSASPDAHSNLLFYLDRPDWRTAGPLLVSWGLPNLTRQIDADNPENVIAAQTAIDRGRVKLRAMRLSSEDAGSWLAKIWSSSGGEEWALLEEDDEIQKLPWDSLPSLSVEDKGSGDSSPTAPSTGTVPDRLQSKSDTQGSQHSNDTEANRRRALELAQPLEKVLQLKTPATCEYAPILRQNTIPGSTIPSLSVWSSRHGDEVPDLAFVLYIPGNKASSPQRPDTVEIGADDENDLDDLLPEDLSLRIFRALDLGVLQTVPWRLDVFSHAPNLQDVVSHYREEKALRMKTLASDTSTSLSTPLDYARNPYQRFRSVLLLADTTTELTSHMSLLLFDPISHDKATSSSPQDDVSDVDDDDEEDSQSSDSLSSSRDLVSLVKFRLGCSGLPCNQHPEHETPRLSRVLYALWDVCNADGEAKRKPQMRSVNELLWF